MVLCVWCGVVCVVCVCVCVCVLCGVWCVCMCARARARVCVCVWGKCRVSCFGWPCCRTMAMATLRRRFMPPERLSVRRC